MADCPHGEHASYCAECLEGPPPERKPPAWKAIGGRFIATYEGSCAGCGAKIVPHQTAIQRYDLGDERTVYVHADLGCRP